LIEQVKIKHSDPKVEIAKAFNVIHISKDLNDVKNAVRKVAALCPNKK
jgi:hypothetical protein